MYLNNEELLGINGGASKWGIKAIGSAIALFVLGMINGFTEGRANYCR